MLHVGGTIRKAKYVPFSIAAAGNERVSPNVITRHAVSVRDAAARDLDFSGSQFAVGCVFFLGAAKLLMWALLKLWLFEG